MAVRPMLVRAVKATLVAFAIVAGGALVAPGLASAAPASQQTVLAPSEFEPILIAPAPVRAIWDCVHAQPTNRRVNFYCEVQRGVVTATIYCSDGTYYYYTMPPGAHSFYLFCGSGAVVTGVEVTG